MRLTVHKRSSESTASFHLGVRLMLVVSLFGILSLLYLNAKQWGRNGSRRLIKHYFGNKLNSNVVLGYAIRNPEGCSIPDFDPFDPKHKSIFHQVERPVCSSSSPVTRIRYTPSGPEIVMNDQVALEEYNADPNYSCCYQNVQRKEFGMRDLYIVTSQWRTLERITPLSNTTEFILVTCGSPPYEENLDFYRDAHALIPDKKSVQWRLQNKPAGHTYRFPSILMIGIDSISRINLKRSMRRTRKYLADNEWLELRGYNKMGENTFPNIMAIVTGYNLTDAYKLCKPTVLHGLDECPIIWKEFKNKGYVTAYGEDRPDINTFNYLKTGFYKQPTDYYMRPYFLAINAHVSSETDNQFCAGPLPAAQHVYNYASAFTTKFRNDSFFALFWLNSFSHEDVNLPAAMDKETHIFLDGLRDSGVLDTSIVFFFSDHGMRYGASRKTIVGFYEERLPFFFAWFPPWFRDKHPDLVQNFRDNSNRLTNPYDFHMTLRHLLSFSNPTPGVEPGTRGCPKCDSLLNPISPLRTCEDASIDPYWCTCGELGEELDINGPQVREMANAVIEYLNKVVLFNLSSCSYLSVHQILYGRHLKGGDGFRNQHILAIETTPGNAILESLVYKSEKENNYKVAKDISRLNAYVEKSDCVDTADQKKFCYCK